jgi:hypothetical protein
VREEEQLARELGDRLRAELAGAEIAVEERGTQSSVRATLTSDAIASGPTSGER